MAPTIRIPGTDKFMTFKLLLTNRKPADNTIRSIAAGMNKFGATRMRLAAATSRIRTVHEDTQVGDKIAHLPNCPLLVVLLPLPGTARYKYIGEVYSETFANLFKDGWEDEKSWKF
jgi:hypothetical protein